jgi:hypothetical protein
LSVYVKVDPRECFRQGVKVPSGYEYAPLPDETPKFSPEDRETLASIMLTGKQLPHNVLQPTDCLLDGVYVPTWEAVQEALPKLREARIQTEARNKAQAERAARDAAAAGEQERLALDAMFQDRAGLARRLFVDSGHGIPGDWTELSRYLREQGLDARAFWYTLKADCERVQALQKNWPLLWTLALGPALSPLAQIDEQRVGSRIPSETSGGA